jgi:RNA polymerase sigma-70 factor (ECF subfamily)
MQRDIDARTDDELLEQFKRGDEAAFSSLVRRHEGRIFGLAMRMLGERADALDATQDTFVAAFRRAEDFRGESSFATWLYRIGINSCKDLLRKKQRAPAPTEEVGEGPANPSSVEDTVTTRLDLAGALARLSEEYREAVCMHDLGGIRYEEIAALTGVSIGTVKSRISRGRRRLAELLEHPGGPPASKEAT